MNAVMFIMHFVALVFFPVALFFTIPMHFVLAKE